MEAARRGEDSWTLAAARYRNRMEQKSLARKVDTLSTNFRHRSSRLLTEIGLLEQQLGQMNPRGGKAIIYPKGLTEAEKAEYRQLRRGSFHRSMSLKEFDAKITDYKHDMRMYRRASNATTTTTNTTAAATTSNNDNSTKKRDMRVFRRASDATTTTNTANNNNNDNNNNLTIATDTNNTKKEDTILVEAGIVSIGDHNFCVPIAKHKQTMREALKRATEAQRTPGVHGELQRSKSRRNRSDGTDPPPKPRTSTDNANNDRSSQPVSGNSLDNSSIEIPSRPKSRISIASSSGISLENSEFDAPSRPKSRVSFVSSASEASSQPKSKIDFENSPRPRSGRQTGASALKTSTGPLSRNASGGRSENEASWRPKSRKSFDVSSGPGPQVLRPGNASSRPSSGTYSDHSSRTSYVITYSERLHDDPDLGLEPSTPSSPERSQHSFRRSNSHPGNRNDPVTMVGQVTLPPGATAGHASAARRLSSATGRSSPSSCFSTASVSGGSPARGGQRKRSIVIRPDYVAARRRSSVVSVAANTGWD